MEQVFLKTMNNVLAYEGGFSIDPDDGGNWTGGKSGLGELLGTKWGISAASYPTLDIKSISREQAISIYYRDFWDGKMMSNLPPQVAACVLDASINMGHGTAVKLLQSVVGTEQDGVIGPHTVAACSQRDQDELVPEYLAARGVYYAGLKNFSKFGKGWMTRLFKQSRDVLR
jgi:lysozyme family protein